MNAKKFSLALGEVNEKYVTEAIEYSGTTKLATRTHFRKALIIAAIITALLLLSAAAYAVIRYYSTTIENTTLYWYTDNGVLTSEQNTSLSPEDAAYELAVLFMDDLKAEKEGKKTFRVTEYKDLSVSVMPTSQMDKETAAIYFLKDEEISPDTWVVEIAVSYKYEGTLSPIGPSNGEWIDVLYQASPVGFLMAKEGNSYSLQSRYE